VVDPLEHRSDRHRLRDLVVLVAIAAVDVAAADRDEVDQERMSGVGQPMEELSNGARLAGGSGTKAVCMGWLGRNVQNPASITQAWGSAVGRACSGGTRPEPVFSRIDRNHVPIR
jgi:hypothetical protein